MAPGATYRDEMPMTGRLKLELRGPDGELKEEREVENLITTVGKNGYADQSLASPTIGKPSHMAIGTGSSAEVVGDTALQTETARVALTTKTRSGNVLTYVATFGAGVGTGVLREAGILNASSAGDLFHRVTYGAMTKNAGDSLTVTWTCTQG